jgi:hydroxymethylglutaryl-CoA lyase
VVSKVRSVAALSVEALVPNLRGTRDAVAAGVDVVVVVIGASTTFNQRNIGMTRQESLEGLGDIVTVARDARVRVSLSVSTAFGCVYEGPVAEADVMDVVTAAASLGIDEIVLADTIGIAKPSAVAQLVGRVSEAVPGVTLGLHLHDTYGRALANAWAGVEGGVRLFDSSVGGIGGCPFSPGATGNVSTEALVAMLERQGLSTGIDQETLAALGQRLATELAGSGTDRALVNP